MSVKKDQQERIISAALELFCKRGFHAVGTAEICERAKVLKGTLYHFFASKSDIAIAALLQYGKMIEESFRKAVSGKAKPEKRLARIFDLTRQSAETQKLDNGMVCGCVHGNLAMEVAATDPRVRETLMEINQKWAEVLIPPIQEMIDNQAIPPCDPLIAAQTMLAFLNGAMLAAKTANKPEILSEMGRSVFRLLGGKELTSGK